MKVLGKGQTIAGETYQSLRESILSGQLNPGDKIRTQELCQKYDVSLGAVRESLSQLMAEGLVTSEAHRGYTVAPISVEDLRDLTHVRIEIESLCLRWSIERGKLDWESNLIAATHRLNRTARAVSRADPGHASEWSDVHAAYHAALASACGSPRLLKLRQQLYDQSERYRVLEHILIRSRDSGEEHQQIADAAIERNATRAVQLLSDHFALTTENIIRAMQKKSSAPARAATKPRRAVSKKR